MRHALRDTVRQLAEYRARICLMGLKELRYSWNSESWISRPLFQLLDSETANKLDIADLTAGWALAAKATEAKNTIADQSIPGTSQEKDIPVTTFTKSNHQSEQSLSRTLPSPVPDSSINTNTEINSDFMSQLLNVRDADDAFFDGTMDFNFSSAEMNLDAIFDTGTSSTIACQRGSTID